jgi:hypothetical protein
MSQYRKLFFETAALGMWRSRRAFCKNAAGFAIWLGRRNTRRRADELFTGARPAASLAVWIGAVGIGLSVVMAAPLSRDLYRTWRLTRPAPRMLAEEVPRRYATGQLSDGDWIEVDAKLSHPFLGGFILGSGLGIDVPEVGCRWIGEPPVQEPLVVRGRVARGAVPVGGNLPVVILSPCGPLSSD